MFVESFFKDMRSDHVGEIMEEVKQQVKDKLLIDGKWYADYKRNRIVAVKGVIN